MIITIKNIAEFVFNIYIDAKMNIANNMNTPKNIQSKTESYLFILSAMIDFASADILEF
jgi:hypothetical protein